MAVAAKWLAKARRTPCHPVYIVRLYTEDPPHEEEGTNRFSFASQHGTGYPASLSGISEVATSYDVVTREAKRTSRTITFRSGDGVIRRLVSTKNVKNKKVEVRLGFQGLDEGDFALLGTYTVREVLPSETAVELQCEDQFALDSDYETKKTYLNLHPFEVVADLLQIAVNNGNISSSAYDAAADLDPSLEKYEPIAHFNVCRANIGNTEDFNTGDEYMTGTVGAPDDFATSDTCIEKRSISVLWRDLMRLCQCYFGPDDTGVWRVKRFDRTAAKVDAWSRRDVRNVQQKSTFANLTNQFVFEALKSITWGLVPNGSTETEETQEIGHFERNDLTSQAAYAYPEAPRFVAPQSIESIFLNGFGVVDHRTILPSPRYSSVVPLPLDPTGLLTQDTESFRVTFAAQHGFSGVRHDPITTGSYDPTLQPDWSKVTEDSGRKVYLMLCGNNRRKELNEAEDDLVLVNGHPEIICCNLVEVEGSPHLGHNANYGPIADPNVFPNQVRFTIDTAAPNGGRAQFEDASQIPYGWGPEDNSTNLNATIVVDVTAQVYWAQGLLERFANGAPVIEVYTDLSKMDVQLGDFVSVEEDVFLAYGLDGSDENTVFEVVSKQVDALGDSPGIRWELVFVRQE